VHPSTTSQCRSARAGSGDRVDGGVQADIGRRSVDNRDLGRANVRHRRPPDSRDVRSVVVDDVVVDHGDLAHAEPDELFANRAPGTACSDDANVELREEVLTVLAERPHLPIEYRRWCIRRR
jgi:hypothetical protein